MKCRRFEDHQIVAQVEVINHRRMVVLTCEKCVMRFVVGKAKRRSFWQILKRSIQGE